MALTLRAAINDTQTAIDVLGSDALALGIVQIDSEFLDVRAVGTGQTAFGQAAFRRVSTVRGHLGSPRASHAASATVTPVQLVVQTDAPTAPPPATAGGAVVQAVYSRTTDLTDAQIKALPTTPVEILPAQGAGTVAAILQVIAHLNTEAGRYTNQNATVCLMSCVFEGVAAPVADYDENNDAMFGSEDESAIVFVPWARVSGSLVASGGWGYPVNKALLIQFDNNGAGNFTGGDPVNSMSVTVLYAVIEP